jgi:protein-S-isoprenylcysteine O-methyltransferase Ste14
LLIFLGMAISFQNWLGFAVLLIPTTLAFLRRITIEERALRGALGEAYINYSARTWRLIPLVY